MLIKFFGKKLLFIVAHPDDESFAASGTMVKNHKLGGQNIIICATYGEKGRAHITKPITQRELKIIRKKELLKAAKLMRASVKFLGLPDTGVNEKKPILKDYLSKTIKQISPDYVFSFGPGGSSGHLDHIAAGNIAKIVSKKAGIPFVAFAVSPEFANRRKLLKARRKHGIYNDKSRRTLPNIKIKVDQKMKIKILRCYKSQMDKSSFANLPKNSLKNIFRYEYFKLT
jgi:N-acetylglucosamine malate deacetylase 2